MSVDIFNTNIFITDLSIAGRQKFTTTLLVKAIGPQTPYPAYHDDMQKLVAVVQ
jgi:hypothetical protein